MSGEILNFLASFSITNTEYTWQTVMSDHDDMLRKVVTLKTSYAEFILKKYLPIMTRLMRIRIILNVSTVIKAGFLDWIGVVNVLILVVWPLT